MIDCDSCGHCCKFCDKHPDLIKFDRGDGVCIHLKKDNTCAIYSIRPNVCNVRAQYQNEYYKKMSPKEYTEMMEEGCRKLKEMFDEQE